VRVLSVVDGFLHAAKFPMVSGRYKSVSAGRQHPSQFVKISEPVPIL
jgi:hypothetical protein